MWVFLHFGLFTLTDVYKRQEKVPFDYTVILGGLGGGAVAVLNFFLMGLTVQKAAACEDEGSARMRLKASYSQRMLLQLGWGIAAIIAPCFQFAAGLLPLLFQMCIRDRPLIKWRTGFFSAFRGPGS